MSRKLNIRPGSVFGRWTVLRRVAGTGHTRCLCRCTCGMEKSVTQTSLIQGRTKSCGCLRHAPRTFSLETRARMSAAHRLRPLRSLVGLRYGRLVVLADAGWTRPSPSGKRYLLVRCRCDCGNEKVVRCGSISVGASRTSLGTRSCGCLQVENARHQVSLAHGRMTIHGESHPITPEYRSYTSMRNRCLNKNNRLVTWNGQTKTISEWASELHIPYHRIWGRLQSGRAISEALSSEVSR